MARTLILFACILLTACAPVVVPSGGDVLPAEAVRILDRATATAAAAGTQLAAGLATDSSARATATSAAQFTRDTLAIEQTRAALGLTQSAAAADATDAAAVRTQSALATAAWATPTAAALHTQSAIAATQLAGDLARAESSRQFWDWLRWTTIITIMALAATLCVLVLMRGLAGIAAEDRRQRAAIAREALQLLGDGHYAQWQPGSGYQVQALPAPLDAPPVIIDNAPTQPSRVHEWRNAVRLFGFRGSQYGFVREKLMELGIVTDPVYRRLARLLKDAGVLGDVVVPGKRGRQTGFTPDWDYPRLSLAISAGEFDAHYPTTESAPKVAWGVPTLTTEQTEQPDNRTVELA